MTPAPHTAHWQKKHKAEVVCDNFLQWNSEPLGIFIWESLGISVNTHLYVCVNITYILQLTFVFHFPFRFFLKKPTSSSGSGSLWTALRKVFLRHTQDKHVISRNGQDMNKQQNRSWCSKSIPDRSTFFGTLLSQVNLSTVLQLHNKPARNLTLVPITFQTNKDMCWSSNPLS